MELRVNWRLRVTTQPDKGRFADESLVMLDRLASMNPTLSIYGLRARAGFAADRPDVVVESLSNYARLGLGMVRAGVQAPESLQPEAKALLDILETVSRQNKVDANRVAEVRAEIRLLLPN
jgi:hypothetical protein